jgi:hypothetical protein
MKPIKATENKQVGQKNKNSSVFAIPASAAIPIVTKFDNSTKMAENELNELIETVKLECEDSIFLGGYEDCIIGYDYNSKAIIYDGDQILNRMADAAIAEDLEGGIEVDEDDRWEYYYDAVDYFECNVLRFFDLKPFEENRPRPIILRRFS